MRDKNRFGNFSKPSTLDERVKSQLKKEMVHLETGWLRIAMLSVHSCPIGELGTKNTGGMSVYIRELARELANCGHEVDIYTRDHNGHHEPVLDLCEGVRLIHIRVGNNGQVHKLALYPHLPDFFRGIEKFRWAEDLQYDLIHSHYWLSGRLGNWAQKHWNAPHIFMFHTIAAMKDTTGVEEKEPELRIATEKQLAKNCDRILAATEKEREQLIRLYRASSEKIGVIPCGVNLDLFRPMDKKTVRQRLGFKPDARIVLYVGRFAPLKGIDRLLEAAAYLQHHRPMRLVLIGGDGVHTPETQRLQKRSRELGIQDRVIFAGRIEQKDLPPYYNAADVLVVPSYYESFGLVALEALACGTPVVAGRVGDMENILLEGITGHVISHVSPRSLADAIAKIISRPQLPPPDVIRASVLRFGWANVAAEMVDEYMTALQQHPAAVIEDASVKVSCL